MPKTVYKCGIVFGCFIPLHKGHMAMIEQAAKENHMTIIGVTGHDYDRGMDTVPFLRRLRLMQEIYGNQRDLVIVEVDDKKLGLTGTFSESAWRTWSDELFRNASFNPENPHRTFTWYTGEDRYIEKLSTIYPNHRFVKLDRSVIPVSGTTIRENPNKYREYIHPRFQEYLRRMGTL